MQPKRYLVVTADDFGIGPATSRGILDLAGEGLVTATVLQESFVRPVAVPVTETVADPAGRLAIVLGLTVTALLAPLGLPLAGQAASVKFVSTTVQFRRSAVPELVTPIVTALLPFASFCAQFFVTVRPGVRQSNLAVSCAVAFRFGFCAFSAGSLGASQEFRITYL